MNTLPFVSCLCPTYCRPKLLEKSIAMFEAQDYPDHLREMVIFDDGPNAKSSGIMDSSPIRYFAVKERFSSLPQKFNAIAKASLGTVFCVWEDDDEYRPWHISAHVAALENGNFSKPSRVLSDYGEEPEKYHEEGGAGRFHASMAFTRKLYDKIGGWPDTNRADFDQQMIARLAAYGTIADPCEHHPPSYVFRWHTGHYHGQSTMDKGPSDETWYDRVRSN